jgi:hypothetical protein
MDPRRREAYDSQRREHALVDPAPSPAARSSSTVAAVSEPPAPAPTPFEAPQAGGVDEFLKKAALSRFRKAVETELAAFDEVSARGFDAGYETRARTLLDRDWKTAFKKSGPPIRLFGRVVSRVDAASVDEIWPLASRAATPEAPVCVFLMGAGLAPTRELADAIATQRRRQRNGPAPVVVPVDVRNWQALIPADAPPPVKAIVERLREN